MQPLISLYRSSLKEYSRDRMAMFWTLAFPIFFILLFGAIFSGNSSDTVFDVGVVAEDSGQIASALDQAFEHVDAFNVIKGSRDELMGKLKKGDVRVVIIIPAGFSEAIGSNQPTNIEVSYDPSSQTTSQVVLTIVQKIVDSFDQQITQRPTLIQVKQVSVLAEHVRYIDFLLPGILGMALMQLGLFGTAPALVQLRETQVLRRIGATPLPRATLLAAQVMFRLTIAVVQSVLLLVVGQMFFKFQVAGSPLVLAGFVLLGACIFITMGYLISGLAKTQESVIGISQMINFPMMFLSGLFFPLEIMPSWIRPISDALPLTYLADALRQSLIGSTAVHPLGLDFLVLLAWLVVCSLHAMRFFRWE
ncbi:ABC transporter permease [Candidatus Acetothermia bacterium]|nr:ABC transporter permease [Candidatus Acetothermia bacterium]MBI3643002.1 ABC transporter permease [Candidatus Acetothermia bacterium]